MRTRDLTTLQVALGLDVSHEAVRLWKLGKRQVPAKRALEIERRFGIPRHELRPDLWEPPKPRRRAPRPEPEPPPAPTDQAA